MGTCLTFLAAPPSQAAGTIIAIPTIQFLSGASPGNDTIAHPVNASSITPMITACRTADRRASHAVTYPPAAMHNAVYVSWNRVAGRLWLIAARFGSAWG